EQAGATMTEIVQAVKRVTDIMSEIAAASNEQSAGIEQVNQAITQMDEVTQQNAALVEEAAAAAEAMQKQASVLLQAVSVFKLEGGRAWAEKFGDKSSAHPMPVAAVQPKNSPRLAKASEENGDGWHEF
ncbi:MAG: methyl-accepting chemotaxis protein, partial [Gallionella sp.]|nr:methyl-accepting chemotaxis protein [Gallionella sp.]